MMRNRMGLTMGMLAALGLAACSTSHETTTAPVAAAARTPVVSGVVAENAITATATVESIDQKTRMVTLRGPDGKLTTVHAGDQVKNLAQVKKGDLVTVTYYESLAYEVHKPGQAEPGVVAAAAGATAKPGEMPAAAGAQAVTVTSTINAIDKTNNTVTLKGPDGNLTTIKVRDPSKLDKVKVGDLVEITYTEALAIGVEAAKR